MLYLFIALAAIFKAVADTLADHYTVSIFRYKDPRFWCKKVSAQYAPFIRFTKYRWDAWHLANSGMIVSFIIAALFGVCFKWWIDFIVSGIVFNLVFNLFYNKILRK